MAGEHIIKVIVFSGKKEDFTDYWDDKFLACASFSGFQDLLARCKPEEVTKDSTILEATQADEKEQIRIKDFLKGSFEELLLSVDTSTAAGKVAFCIIKGCNTNEYPNGNKPKAWKRLCEKYIDKSAPTLIKSKRKLSKSRLKENTKDPEEWITELEELCDRLEDMGSIMSDEYLMIHILNNLPLEYELQVEQMKVNSNQDINLVTLKQVCSTWSLQFEIINVYNEGDTYDEELEKALVTRQFKGRCNNCENFGHKKQD